MNFEIIGYVASILVAISLTMSKILKLRIINLIGALTFAVYGYLIGAYSVIFANSFIVCLNIYFLLKMYRNKDSFDILDCTENKGYLEQFFGHYNDDIKNFFPEFNSSDLKSKSAIFILRNMRPVNLVIYNKQDNDIIEIILDYTIPEYRDFLNGQYLLELFKDKQLVAKSESKEHIKYLKRLGFEKNEAELFVRKI